MCYYKVHTSHVQPGQTLVIKHMHSAVRKNVKLMKPSQTIFGLHIYTKGANKQQQTKKNW